MATKENEVLRYVHQDHLTGTSLMTDASGAQIGETMKYLPFGGTLSGAVPTDKKFTGQRLDETGLYYYGARYYDCVIGRFISADSIIPNFANPQCFNRYSYCLNNPLKYVDPSGHDTTTTIDGIEYKVIYDGNGNHHLLGTDGSVTGSLPLKDLLDMISSYMTEVGDWSNGGGPESGPVINFNVDFDGYSAPIFFLPEGHSRSTEMAGNGILVNSSPWGSIFGKTWGGVEIRYQVFSSSQLEYAFKWGYSHCKSTFAIDWVPVFTTAAVIMGLAIGVGAAFIGFGLAATACTATYIGVYSYSQVLWGMITGNLGLALTVAMLNESDDDDDLLLIPDIPCP